MKTMTLQQIGTVPAIEAGELKVGDVTMWNFGSTETVLEFIKETAKTIVIKIRCDSNGNTYERRLNKTRLVCRK